MNFKTNKQIKQAKLELKHRLLEHSKEVQVGSDEMQKTISQLSQLEKVEDGSISKDKYFTVGGSIVAGLVPIAVKYVIDKKKG